jgi:NDP-sugar pyrophosphorylase family protein
MTTPKQLIKVGGERLIDRLIRIFMDNDADRIVIICNDRTAQVASHLVALQRDGLYGRPIPLRFIAKSTLSSMHSFFEISRWLTDEPFVLTTVDTLFNEKEFAAFVADFKRYDGDGLMGVTGYVDDEKPLWVTTDERQNITGFLDERPSGQYQPLVSAGIYALQPTAIFTLNNCIARAEQRMRNFQRAMLNDHRKLKAWIFGKVLDIDHTTDIDKAEQLF